MAPPKSKLRPDDSKTSVPPTPEPPASAEDAAAATPESGESPPIADEGALQDQGPRLSPVCATYQVAEEPYPGHHLWFYVRRKKTTIFLSGRDDMSVEDLKETIQSITKVPIANQRLFKGTTVMKDDMKLYDYGFGSGNKPQNPNLLGLVFKTPEGNYEDLDITPYTPAPELPAFMTKEMFK